MNITLRKFAFNKADIPYIALPLGTKCYSFNFIKIYNKRYNCVVLLKLLMWYYEVSKGLIS